MPARTIFLAGAAGVIGRCLAPLLLSDGWRVVGTTRSQDRAAELRRLGVEAAVVDVYDADALDGAVARAGPEVVIHQLTDLPRGIDPAQMAAARERNARIRIEGTRNLLAASARAGARRVIAQSIAFAYAPGLLPHGEDDPLNIADAGSSGVTARGVASLEQQVLAAPMLGVVLRYGRLYGPGTGVEAPPKDGPLHIQAAAEAARIAVMRGEPGIYNIAEDDGFVDVSKARRLLGLAA